MAGPKMKKRQIVGYTSGVFDLFHVGHLRILQRAKALCDRLIVGVTVDDLVGYKNQNVVVPFDQRLEIVSGLKAVDLAIPQDDLDKFVMWKKLKFDVMFIGDDWFDTGRFKDYERKLKSAGVKIVYLPYTTDISTSGLKSKLGTASPRSFPHPRVGRKKRKTR
ncbi:MAG: adenylyltransferase/cytidyltransferase family protein [Candidatus Aminicenantes bacterium]|nr:adenylyltransferase/cytidyltransferase family protein [Candidatus Aminicenantes bacterium]